MHAQFSPTKSIIDRERGVVKIKLRTEELANLVVYIY